MNRFKSAYDRLKLIVSDPVNTKGVFWFGVHEPMRLGSSPQMKPVRITKPMTLAKQFEKYWFNFGSASINGKSYTNSWEYYTPRDGDKIVLFPVVETKLFSNAYIAKINAESEGGVLLRAIVFVEDPVGPVIRRFVDHDKAIVIEEETFSPLPMRWDGYELSGSMSLPQMRITTHNLGARVSDYVETIDVLDNDVTLYLFHIDLLDDVQARDIIKLQVQGVEGDDLFITFNLGINLGLQDLLPRGVITPDEFPAIISDALRY